MFITLREWRIAKHYEDTELVFGEMVQSPVNVEDLSSHIKFSPTFSGHTNQVRVEINEPKTVIIFKNTSNIQILNKKLNSIIAALPPYRYDRKPEHNHTADLCDRLQKMIGKEEDKVCSGKLFSNFTILIWNTLSNNIHFADFSLSQISSKGRVLDEPNSLSVKWDVVENKANGVYFFNAFENIHLKMDDANRLARNIEVIFNRTKSPLRKSNDYFIIPCVERNDTNYSCLRTIPSMTVDGIIQFFNAERKGTKLDTFVTAIRNMTPRYTEPYNAIQSMKGKQLLFVLSDGRRAGTRLQSLPLDTSLMISSFCRIISSQEKDNGDVNIIAEVKESQCDDFANMLFSYLEKSKMGANVACIESNQFDDIITHFLLTNGVK